MEPRYNFETVMPPTAGEVDTLKKDVSGLMKRFSDPIPTQIITKNYSAKIEDQRIAHISDAAHSITIVSAYLARNRRFLFINAGAGVLTITGDFLGARTDAAGVMTNPVLQKGEAIEFFSFFVPNGGTDPVPEDLQIDGVKAIATGKYKYQIVNFYTAKLSPQYIKDEIARVEALANAAQTKANQVDAGLTATNSNVAALSSSLASALAKIAALESKKDFTLTPTIGLPVLAVNGVKDFTFNFPSPMPNIDYTVASAIIGISSSLLLGKLSIIPENTVKTTTGVTIRVKTAVAITLTTESVTLLVVARSN